MTCLEVVGNEAWIGGVINHSSLPGREGTRACFAVVDRGDGRPPDQASLLIVGDATVTCHTRPLIPAKTGSEGRSRSGWWRERRDSCRSCTTSMGVEGGTVSATPSPSSTPESRSARLTSTIPGHRIGDATCTARPSG